MNKLKILLFAIILTACTSAPQQGEVDLHCTYVQQSAEKYSFVCEKISTPSGSASATPTSPVPLGSSTPTTRPTNTAVPTATVKPTDAPVPTVTATPVPSTDNLFINPGFEGGAIIFTWPDGLRLPEVATVLGWKPFFCDFPYKDKPCPAMFQGTKNPNNLLMGRPEMRNTTVVNRVRSGTGAQYAFCQFRTCKGGVYQTVQTVPGQICTASVYIQSWSRADWDNKLPIEVNLKSEFPNDDGYSNSLWRIAVDPYGGVNIDSTNVVKSSWYSIPKSITSINGESVVYLDHYDKYAQMTYTFTAKGSFATIYFENLRLFPFTFNDSAWDDASIVCSGGNGLPATAVPTVVSTPVVFPTSIGNFNANQVYKIVKPSVSVYSRKDTSSAVLMAYHQNDEIKVRCVAEAGSEVFWGSVSACSPEPTNWFLLKVGLDIYATPLAAEG
jgi:hypothetical protein